MPIFPSRDWCEQMVARINADDEARLLGQDWEADFGVVVSAGAGLDTPFVVHLVPNEGEVERVEYLDDPDDLEDIEPDYVVRADYPTWKLLIERKLDPVEAVLKRRIVVQGDLQPLLERARHRHLAERLLSGIETRFIDEQG